MFRDKIIIPLPYHLLQLKPQLPVLPLRDRKKKQPYDELDISSKTISALSIGLRLQVLSQPTNEMEETNAEETREDEDHNIVGYVFPFFISLDDAMISYQRLFCLYRSVKNVQISTGIRIETTSTHSQADIVQRYYNTVATEANESAAICEMEQCSSKLILQADEVRPAKLVWILKVPMQRVVTRHQFSIQIAPDSFASVSTVL